MLAGDDNRTISDVSIPMCKWTDWKNCENSVANASGIGIMAKKGQNLGVLQEIEMVTASMKVDKDSSFKLDALNVGDSKPKSQIQAVEQKYDKVMQQNAGQQTEIPIVHEIVLSDNKPVSAPVRRIPHSQRDEIERQVELLKELGISKVRTTGYNPRSNGLTEQSNSIVKDYLTAYVHGNSTHRCGRDTWARELAFAYNISVHSSTGFTPVELMFGRKFRVPNDMLFETFSRDKTCPMSIEQFNEELSYIYELARQNMSTRQKISASYYDKKIIDDKLLPRDLVYMYQSARSRKKLEVKWDGPYRVVVETHPVYHVEVNSKDGTTKCLTRDKLRRVGENKLGDRGIMVSDKRS